MPTVVGADGITLFAESCLETSFIPRRDETAPLTQRPAPGDCLEEERFGRSLAAGDFDADGFDDLAVGNSETISGDILAGSVQVFYGSPRRALPRRRTGPSASCGSATMPSPSPRPEQPDSWFSTGTAER